MRLNELSATEAARLIAEGAITSEQLVQACLDHIETREPVVNAWAWLDPEHALGQARERDRSPAVGPLHGVPVAVKDVLDTYDMPTGMGSPIYKDHRPVADASCVALARVAGAVILGKTVTAEFAGQAPGATTNPHNPKHTPGGSSSGSAAAVADCMVPVAFGTQTAGSVVRPAAFCGVIGYKPTFGLVNRAGLKFAAENLDTIGVLARSLDDVALTRTALLGAPTEKPEIAAAAPRLGFCHTPIWSKATPEARDAVESAAARLRQAGALIDDFALPHEFGGLVDAQKIISNVERARAMAYEWAHRREHLSPQLSESIRLGSEVPHQDYVEALRLAEHCRIQLDMFLAGIDALVAPAANGEAPAGLNSTGDSAFQALWSVLHVPSITLPTHCGPNGLPVGIQLIAPRYRDEALLRTAAWVWDVLGASGSESARAMVA